MSARAVAGHLVHLATRDAVSVGMVPERLHLTLFYCQGWHWAWFGRALFSEAIRAGADGPRIPAIAAFAWGHGEEPISKIDAPVLSKRDRKSVEQVWEHFGRYPLASLRAKARAEAVWARRAADGEEISAEELFDHFGAEYARLTGETPGSAAVTERNLSADAGKTLEQIREERGW